MIVEQGEDVDNIRSNIESAKDNVEKATRVFYRSTFFFSGTEICLCLI